MGGLSNLVTINLDKERHLRLTLKGMLEFQKITGKNLLKGFNFRDLTIEDSAALTWACLIHEDKELTYDNVLEMVDVSNFTTVMEALKDCIVQSQPEAKEGGSPLAGTSQPG